MLTTRLWLRTVHKVKAASSVYFILNSDASVVSGRNYVWMDSQAWTDANKWKDTGLGA